MDTPTREEMDAKIEASETRIDYRLRSIEEKMETRFAQFEVKFAQFEARSAAQLAAFKSEMLNGMAGLVKWIVGTAIALGATGITVMSFVLNNAIPKALAAPPPAVVINLPAPSAPAR